MKPGFIFQVSLISATLVTFLLLSISKTVTISDIETQNIASRGVENAKQDISSTSEEFSISISISSETTDQCQVSNRFPNEILRWCNLITSYASKRNLDPNLIAAIIYQESRGNPDAISRSGAIGLMQVMPRDGIAANFECVNGPCFASRPSTAELLDPEFNIKYGTRILYDLISRLGNIREAIKAYGPANYGYGYADKVLNIRSQYGK